MSRKELVVRQLTDLDAAAKIILDDLKNERVFAISGKMGAGKTTLIKSFCDVLGVEDIVSSPTFALVNEYTDVEQESVFHFDFYRIKKIEEVYDIGYEEYLYSGNYCFMEWPGLIVNLLPSRYVDLNIKVMQDDSRIISYRILSA